MKIKSLFQTAFSLLMLLCVSLTAQGKKTPIASLVQNQGGYTLLFEYKDISGENFDSSHQWKDNDILDTDNPGWQTFHDEITKVVFSPDFAEVQPTTLKNWFQNFSKLTSIEGLEYLNTGKVKSMESTFGGCRSLTSLDLTHFNTSASESFFQMFNDCRELTSVKGKFNCANATTLSRMFMNCKKLNSINMSSFTNTSKVEDMSAMFYGCESLRSLIFPESFDSSNVKLMFMLFQRCKSLSQLDISHFSTDKATDMRYMFAECEYLENLDVTSFRTDNVTKMYGMFMDCSLLNELNLCNFNTDNVTDMNFMFYNCNCLTTIYCNEAWNTTAQSVSMFLFCFTLSGAINYDEEKIDNNYANPSDGYFTAEKVIDYKIKIAGVPVTNLNCKDLTGIPGVNVVSGQLSYDPQTNTLLIDRANIGGGEYPAIECDNEGLTIKVGRGRSMGYNMLTSNSAPVLKILNETTIKGDPQLWMMQNDGGLYLDGPTAVGIGATISSTELVIEDALVYAKGSGSGIRGDYYMYGTEDLGIVGKLTIKGVSNVQVYGNPCISTLLFFSLEDHNTIISPRNAFFRKETGNHLNPWSGLCYQNGELVKDETVFIAYFNPADVNLDQEVNISDVVAVINTMAGDKTFENTADVNSDNDVNISDVVMVINVMAGGKVPLPAPKDAATEAGYCPDTNHPHVIDLGSAGKWACCNVGAKAPWEYGGYYAWGETEEKSTYDFSYYTLWSFNMPQLLADIKGNTAYDVAAKEWGSNWRMPNSAQTVNLYSNVKSIEKVTLNGVNGMKITAANGNAIFIPFGGYIDGSVKKKVGENINLWSSTQAEPNSAFTLYSDGSSVIISLIAKCCGLNVRPVAE